MKFTDIRYLRTEKLIFDAFAKLLSEKPYEKLQCKILLTKR